MRKTLAVILLAAGCASSNNMSGNMDAETYIRSAGPRFMSAFNSGNATTVASFYADDAVLIQAGQPVAKGSSVIREAFGGFLSGNRVSLMFAPDRIVQSGDMAYEYGQYTMQITPTGGTAMTDKGNYVTVWRRQANGDWKIAVDSVVPSQAMR